MLEMREESVAIRMDKAYVEHVLLAPLKRIPLAFIKKGVSRS
jgi:hypothetical protein